MILLQSETYVTRCKETRIHRRNLSVKIFKQYFRHMEEIAKLKRGNILEKMLIGEAVSEGKTIVRVDNMVIFIKQMEMVFAD